jgi:phage replication O-like protein O
VHDLQGPFVFLMERKAKDEMSNPQLENGYTRIADEIMDALIAYRIPGEQMQCVLFIIKKTYGFNKVWDMISNSQFVKATGIKKPNVSRAIKALVDKNLVIKKDNNLIPSYSFNKKYKSWKRLSKKITRKIVIKKDIQQLSKKIPTIDTITIDNISKRFKFQKKVPIPDDFCLIPEMTIYAKNIRYNRCLETFTEKMILSAKSNGYKKQDWYATWQNWLRNDIKWNPENQDKIKIYDK